MPSRPYSRALRTHKIRRRTRSLVIVHSGRVRTAASVSAATTAEGACTFKRHTDLLLVCTHTEWEDLVVDLT